MTKFFVDSEGNYLGAFDGAEPPVGAIEVFDPPTDGRQKYIGGRWSTLDAERKLVAKSVVQQRIILKGKMGEAYDLLTRNPDYFARWFAPDHPAVYCDDQDAVGLVAALGLDPKEILAPE